MIVIIPVTILNVKVNVPAVDSFKQKMKDKGDKNIIGKLRKGGYV